ncbi:MAG TPA: phosphoribosylaminoimidazolesuccinocarboxamide synthase [Methanomicrobiales archaeon]|nr:phosphoribosylaminoimidazolesuccinocarboxamide synthase [Methanomicrobiales archaeon]
MKKGALLYRGKAKSVYLADNLDEVSVEFRDDITAFDGEKKAVLADKGVYNAAVSAFFFEYLEIHGVKTHYIHMLDRRTMLVRKLQMIPLEVIVRNVAAGSLVKKYPFTEGQVLKPTVMVIDYKDDSRHDPMINDDIIFALGLVTREELLTIRKLALRVNDLLRTYLAGLNITLVDFKLEFGRWRGDILVGDEISMDSMRLWDAKTLDSLDKDVYRFDKGDVRSTYAAVAERITPGALHRFEAERAVFPGEGAE